MKTTVPLADGAPARVRCTLTQFLDGREVPYQENGTWMRVQKAEIERHVFDEEENYSVLSLTTDFGVFEILVPPGLAYRLEELA